MLPQNKVDWVHWVDKTVIRWQNAARRLGDQLTILPEQRQTSTHTSDDEEGVDL